MDFPLDRLNFPRNFFKNIVQVLKLFICPWDILFLFFIFTDWVGGRRRFLATSPHEILLVLLLDCNVEKTIVKYSKIIAKQATKQLF